MFTYILLAELGLNSNKCSEWAGVAGGGIILLLYGVGAHYFGGRHRMARLRRRAAMPENCWFDEFLNVSTMERAALRPLLQALGQAIGIDWTRLRPDDRFSAELGLGIWGSGLDDLAELDDALYAWIKREHINTAGLNLRQETLSGFLDRSLEAYRDSRASVES